MVVFICPLISIMKDQVLEATSNGLNCYSYGRSQTGGHCKMGLTSPGLLRFVTLVHLPFSVRSLDHFCRFTCVHEGHFMLWNKEEFQIELSRKIVLWQFFIVHKSAWFPLLSACRLIEFDTSVTCHVFMYCKGSFLSRGMLLNLHEFAFEGQNMKCTVNMLLTCILYCAPGPAAIRTVYKHSR